MLGHDLVADGDGGAAADDEVEATALVAFGHDHVARVVVVVTGHVRQDVEIARLEVLEQVDRAQVGRERMWFVLGLLPGHRSPLCQPVVRSA